MIYKKINFLYLFMIVFCLQSYSQFSDIEKQILQIAFTDTSISNFSQKISLNSSDYPNSGYFVFRFYKIGRTEFVNVFNVLNYPITIRNNDTLIFCDPRNNIVYQFNNKRILIMNYKNKNKLFWGKLKIINYRENIYIDSIVNDILYDTNNIKWKTYKIKNDTLIETNIMITPIFSNESVGIKISENLSVVLTPRRKKYNFDYRIPKIFDSLLDPKNSVQSKSDFDFSQ